MHLFTKRLEKHTDSGPPVHWGVTIVIINTVIFFFLKGKNTGLEQLRVILGFPHSLSQGVPRDRSHLPFPLLPPNPQICPGREVKESFSPGVTNSYLTLKTPKSVLLPFSGHSASTLWVSHSVSDQGAKGIS